MKIFSTSHTHGAHGLKGPHAPKNANGSGPAQQADKVEISLAAQEASRLAEAVEARAVEQLKPADGSIRTELVTRLKQEIASGAYESPDKIDAAIERLVDQHG